MFTKNNTAGYTDAQMEALNLELAVRLQDIEPHTDDYYRVEHAFSDEVASR